MTPFEWFSVGVASVLGVWLTAIAWWHGRDTDKLIRSTSAETQALITSSAEGTQALITQTTANT